MIQAFRITPGIGMEFLGFPPGTDKTRATAINEQGDVVGTAFLNPNNSRAFLFTDEGGIQALPFATNPLNSATGINIHRQVVGTGLEGAPNGWVWTAQTGTRNLTDLIDPALGLAVERAWGINDRGQIITTGLDLDDSINPKRILLLTPLNTAGDLDGDGVVNAADLANLLGSWGPCPPKGDCPADLNGDGVVDAADLAMLLGNWG